MTFYHWKSRSPIPFNPYEEVTGHLPAIFLVEDDRPAAQQAQERYAYGGWDVTSGFALNVGTMALTYPDDPPMEPIAYQLQPLTDEVVYLYPSGWVLILNAVGGFDVARMD